MSSNNRIIIALISCLVVLAIGTAGYVLIENYTLLDGLYMSVITIMTVGFGEVKPLSEAGRAFTIILIVLGFGTLAFAGKTVAESLLERVWSGKARTKKMKKKVSILKSHSLVCGFGRVGAAAIDHFKATGYDFVVIEADPDKCRELQELDCLYIEGDATRESVLLEAGIKSAAGLLALLDSDPENLFVVLTARELNPTLHIISRAEEATSEKKILRAGADSVISPFVTAGKQVANDILTATGKHTAPTEGFHRHTSTAQWMTIQDGSSMLGQTIGSISTQMRRDIIGLRRNGRDFIFPDPDTRLETADQLLFSDGPQKIENKLTPDLPVPRKLVIVDDNPVILRLYTRLFQKAGFHPMTATNGREGLDLIIREKPPAAVIDFMLPVLSGIDVCRQIKKTDGCEDIRLILFTADNQPETRNRALDAGADEVVLKSPNASEVVETVLQILKGE
jgi:voltage-gated potassium channel